MAFHAPDNDPRIRRNRSFYLKPVRWTCGHETEEYDNEQTHEAFRETLARAHWEPCRRCTAAAETEKRQAAMTDEEKQAQARRDREWMSGDL